MQIIKIRIDKETRDKFKKACDKNASDMSKAIKQFINWYIENKGV